MKNLVWNMFEKTGNIDVYLEFKKLESIEEKLGTKLNENSKGKWNSNSGK